MYNVIVSEHFKKQIKTYTKKYRSFWDDIVLFLENFDLSQNIALGGNVYKARLSISEMPKGKSNSFRIIIYFIEKDNLITPLCIYYKGDREIVTKKEIQKHWEQIDKELF